MRVKVSEFRTVNVSRRSLCDNCVADICFKREEYKQKRVLRCDMFRSPFVAFKRCVECGDVFEVFSNFDAIDYDRCQRCNAAITLVQIIERPPFISTEETRPDELP